MANLIVQENLLTGNPSTEWDLANAGYTSIEGFATDISVNRGQMISFKINTAATNYRIDIYRLGYYGGLGARKVATLQQTASVQPAPIVNAAIGLVDAGNWSVSASWAVPAAAVSGVYIAHLVRQDGVTGENHIPFIVRDDGALHDIVFQTSDTTWHAYNGWGGYSLYGGTTSESDGRAYKVSYNRPIATRDGVGLYAGPQDFLFGEEIAAIHWLEANGYDVSYIAGIDTDRHGSELLNHKLFISCGHDEYWSGQQRANVEAARGAGVHLAFWSGNEVFWKTRYEASAVTVDGSPTTYRTLVCYKETRDGKVIDPADPPTCTCTWRDPRFSPPGDAGRPENALTGTIFMVDDFREDQIQIPYPMTKLRFWRNTAVANTAPGGTATLVKNYLGYEWDEAPDNGFSPPGLIRLSTTTLSVNSYLLDYGSVEGAGIATHSLTLYRSPASRAIVFGAGTVMWSWGLDPNHDPDPRDTTQTPVDPNVKQAMVNLLADMGVQPASLQPGLVPATASTDTTPPVTVITAPANGATVTQNLTVNITGTATDVGGVVAGVEVSLDGGQTWHPATGTASWSYSWAPAVPGSVTIRARSTDDSLNTESPGASVTVTVAASNVQTLFGSTIPGTVAVNDPNSVELGVKFTSTQAGTISALRFYKGALNTGTHTGTLWTSAGTQLATATFVNETASGWQQVALPTPIAIAANTTYVASYHTPGNYSGDSNYFATAGHVSGPLTAPATGATSGGNGVYAYGSTTAFPTNTFQGSNYWVDVVFNPGGTGGPVATNDSGFVTTLNTALAIPAAQLLANDSDPNGYALAIQSVSAPVQGSVSYNATTQVVTFTPSTGYTGPASFTYTITNGHGGAASANVALTVNLPATTPPPVANNDSGFTTAENTALAIPAAQLLANDSDPSGFTISIQSVGGAVNGAVAYNASTLTVTFTPTTGYVGAASFTYTITNGHAGTATASVSLTVTPPKASNSLFAASSTPGTVTQADPNAVELGVRFQSSVAGKVTAIRFYKGPKNLGTHTAHLWSASGTSLASATFSGETASGWQQVTLTTPVAIAANTIYVASYYTSKGYYSADGNFFASALTNGVLTAPAGSNGVYVYGSGGAFPNGSYNASNYWVDVVFVPS